MCASTFLPTCSTKRGSTVSAAARFVDGGFPVELHPQGIVLTEKIEPYWDRYSLVDETRP